LLFSFFSVYFVFQSAFKMNTGNPNLDTLQDIKRMMERSSRFISLSGWSGICAGICALAGAWAANNRLMHYYRMEDGTGTACPSCLKSDLLLIGGLVFLAALVTATFFTLIKSRKEGVAIWGNAARRLLWNTLLPMMAGAFLLWRMLELKQYELVAPGCLIFYGLALVNGSKYTMGEVRWLGYAEILLGIVNCWALRSGLLFWTLGFGVFHIVYGAAMWWKYDRPGDKKTVLSEASGQNA
jgi:hypothetical protein